MNALVQRLNLSVHVAALKLEEIPESLLLPLQNRDPVQMEEAITNHAVEAEVIARILDMTREQPASEDLPKRISRLYAEWIIPISRKIQVHDLLAKHLG
jgi:chorismate mutase